MSRRWTTVLEKFERKEFVQIRKCREATKEGHLGSNKNVVVQQKMVARWNQKYRDETKESVSVETSYLAAGAETMASR